MCQGLKVGHSVFSFRSLTFVFPCPYLAAFSCLARLLSAMLAYLVLPLRFTCLTACLNKEKEDRGDEDETVLWLDYLNLYFLFSCLPVSVFLFLR